MQCLHNGKGHGGTLCMHMARSTRITSTYLHRVSRLLTQADIYTRVGGEVLVPGGLPYQEATGC